MKAIQTTPAKLRKLLFDNANLYGVLFDTEFTGDELRKALYTFNNQDMPLNHAIEGDCVYIWAVK